jgi:AraC-like DNA-binding protein
VPLREDVRVDPRIRIILRIVDEGKASTQSSLTAASRTLGLSETYLLRLFHDEVGQTFRRYLRRVRMTRAAKLVKETARPIKQIALECGYSDVSNFYRDFRSIYAITPREVRLRELLAPAVVYQVEGRPR